MFLLWFQKCSRITQVFPAQYFITDQSSFVNGLLPHNFDGKNPIRTYESTIFNFMAKSNQYQSVKRIQKGYVFWTLLMCSFNSSFSQGFRWLHPPILLVYNPYSTTLDCWTVCLLVHLGFLDIKVISCIPMIMQWSTYNQSHMTVPLR